MKYITLYTKSDCFACEIIKKMIERILKTYSEDEVYYRVINNSNVVNVYPTIRFKENTNTIAELRGSLPADFYVSVIDKFMAL